MTQVDEEGSVYSTTSSLTDSTKIAYVKSIAKEISKELGLNIAQEDVIEQVFKVMPKLLKDLSMSIGENAQSQMHLDVMYFIRKNRRQVSGARQKRKR
ncbi:unnamed protein product [Penicillium salamii]|nr:unnamed protein product [Penicillium salamii]CAG8326792.1 unnamed protein product [Penicillium salamii]